MTEPTSPMVSILMTSYNSELFVGDAIQSIINQTYMCWELLIADDCSTDGTRNVIASFADARIKTYHNEKNLHYLRTRNKLLNHAQGTFVALLDADDLWDSKKLQLQLEEFDNDPALALCGTLVKYISKEGAALFLVDRKPLSYDEICQTIPKQNVFTGSSIMVKTDVFKTMGGYRDFFNSLGNEDYDLTSRIVEKFKAINIPRELYFYRQYPESTSWRNIFYNPFKLHGHLLIQQFIKERAETGQDSLDRNDIPGIINFIVAANKPNVDDSSLFYRAMMWSSLHRKMYLDAFGNIAKAIWLKPSKWVNFRTLSLLILISCGLIKEKD